MTAITPRQVRAIHTLRRRRGMEDGDYYEMLQARWGAGSCKELTRRQANELLRLLGMPMRKPAPRTRTKPPADPSVAALATGPQRRLIEALVSEIEWRSADGYPRWLEANMGLRAVATREQAGRVIEGLKAMRRRQP